MIQHPLSPTPTSLSKIVTLSGLVVPALAFMAAAIYYSLNIPVYDDITQILWIINTFVEGAVDASTPPEVYRVDGRLHAIFYPNAGHIPVVTRLFALIQYFMGGVNFYYAAVISCGVWVMTVYLLLRYAHESGLSLYALLPLPFLFFSLAQWEAMSSMLGSIQMYIGTLFIPLVVLFALIKNRAIIAAIAFFVALFASGGAMGLLPLGAAYLLWRREWKSCVIFCALCLPSVLLFRHLDVFGPDLLSQHFQKLNFENHGEIFSYVVQKIRYLLIFVGNITTNGSMDLRSLATIHLVTGIFILVSGAIGVVFCRGYELFKLIFLYVLMLATVTTLMRSDAPEGYTVDIVSRYAIFALVSVAMAYLLIMQILSQRWPGSVRKFIFIITLSTAALWTHSFLRGNAALDQLRELRITDMQYYINTGDANRLMWNPEWCTGILNKSKELDVYNYSAIENFQH